MTARNNITQKRLKELFCYSKETGIFIRRIARSGVSKGSEAGTIHFDPKVGKRYRKINIDNVIYPTHRLAWLYVTGRFPVDQIDHIDGNGLNNKWDNLREVSNAENKKNRRLQSTNSSGFCGIHWREDLKKWRAVIQVNKKTIHLGVFKDKDDAINARKAANVKYNFHCNHGQDRPL